MSGGPLWLMLLWSRVFRANLWRPARLVAPTHFLEAAEWRQDRQCVGRNLRRVWRGAIISVNTRRVGAGDP
jgi:hypothetical protein